MVNKLKSCGDEEVQGMASRVVESWKQQVQGAKKQSIDASTMDDGRVEATLNDDKRDEKKPMDTVTLGKRKLSIDSTTPKEEEEACQKRSSMTSSSSLGASVQEDLQTPVEDKYHLEVTSDATRNKCIAMFFSALQVAIQELLADDKEPSNDDASLNVDASASKTTLDANEDDETSASPSSSSSLSTPSQNATTYSKMARDLAIQLEKLLFQGSNLKADDAAYRSKFRSKYLNLREKTNPQLRQGLLKGHISVARFMAMTTQEMASDALRKEIEDIKADNLLKVRSAKGNAAETDMFQCGRCKERRCTYTQMQTRSADEPMTTYVTCVNCGNRWKC